MAKTASTGKGEEKRCFGEVRITMAGQDEAMAWLTNAGRRQGTSRQLTATASQSHAEHRQGMTRHDGATAKQALIGVGTVRRWTI